MDTGRRHVCSAIFLPVSQVNRLAPQLGVCVALKAMAEDVVLGLLCGPGSEDPPPPDVLSSVMPDGEFCYVEALTEDGQAFLDLLRLDGVGR